MEADNRHTIIHRSSNSVALPRIRLVTNKINHLRISKTIHVWMKILLQTAKGRSKYQRMIYHSKRFASTK